MPNIPAIPDKTGGAGSGNLINENNMPTTAPANNANNISVICSPYLSESSKYILIRLLIALSGFDKPLVRD